MNARMRVSNSRARVFFCSTVHTAPADVAKLRRTALTQSVDVSPSFRVSWAGVPARTAKGSLN
ncbi:hypothetical protein TPSea814_000765a [Treponema pallidum subsp. pallidum str. Sea 81-4]|nr:conserved hypothetical protein [Treponema pallidum subsp. pallidum str. Chicago]AHN67423.1 hypothetical protein TPSea814_000765a [Treponema pallidum subsp. pallidum str. Sea 81-4]